MFKIIVTLACAVLIVMFEVGGCNAAPAEAMGPMEEEQVELRSEFRAPLDTDDATGLDEVASDEGDGPDVFEGDDITNDNSRLRNAITDPAKIWPNALLPYVIEEDKFTKDDRSKIHEAIREIESKTCVRLRPRQSGQRDHVYIYKGASGCQSDVGRMGGRQMLSLGEFCMWHGIVLHEFLHALGFHHEHNRADRNDWVKILWDNIEPDMKYNFIKKRQNEIQHLGEEYDYGSVMHYPRGAFAIDPKLDTIEPLRPRVKIGQRKGLSPGDARKINKLYKCRCADKEKKYCADWVRKDHCTDRFWKHNMAILCRKSCDFCR